MYYVPRVFNNQPVSLLSTTSKNKLKEKTLQNLKQWAGISCFIVLSRINLLLFISSFSLSKRSTFSEVWYLKGKKIHPISNYTVTSPPDELDTQAPEVYTGSLVVLSILLIMKIKLCSMFV